MNLTTDELVLIGKPPVATGTTTQTSNIIDCEGAQSTLWTLDLGAVGAANVVSVSESDNSDMSSPTVIGTTIVSGTVPTVSDRLYLVEVIAPLKRYQQLTITRPAATVINSILCFLRLKKRPTAQLASNVSGILRLMKGM